METSTRTTPMKRRLSLLATQCWQNITKRESDIDRSMPSLPKLDNAPSTSPRSSISAPNDATAESGTASSPISQLDDSLFEPIAFVITPPKKRAKNDNAMAAAVAANISVTSLNYCGDLNPMSSLQYQNNYNNYNNYQYYGGQYHAPGMDVPQTSIHGQAATDFFVHYGMTNTRPQHGYTLSATSSFDGVIPSNAAVAAAPCARATAVTPVTTNKRPSITNADTSILLDDFEPLFPDPSENDDNTDRCPDLCASSSSLGSSSSSLHDGGNIIISTSDLFKENNYAKAEVVEVMSGFEPSDLSKQSVVDRLKKQTNKNNAISVPATTTKSKSPETSRPSSGSVSKEAESRFKPFHEEKWNFHFNELLTFKKENGHCLVPHTFPAKPHLARWVKRQRRQYKLRLDGNKHSTMTPDRIKILNHIGFVWDSHEVIWNERFSQLVAYKKEAGHCRVPSYCKDCPQLASWVKCQRRQYKLFWEQGKGSSMTEDRIKLLNSIGFIWEVHPGRKKKEDNQRLTDVLLEE